MPANGYKMVVGGQITNWRNGCCISIDDSFTHSAAYDTNGLNTGPRVVLIVDMWHPDLTMKERNALNAVFQN